MRTNRFITLAAVGLMAIATSACTSSEKRTAGYGVGGAALGGLAGAAIGGNGRGALAGAAIGGVAGTLVGAAQNNQDRNNNSGPYEYCNYTDPYGRAYQAPCSYR